MVILCDCSGRAITITLPEAATNSAKVYYIKKVDSSGNAVTIKGDASDETIDGEASVSLTLQYQYVTIICDSADWYIIGGEYVKMDDLLRDIKSLEDDKKELLEKILKQLEKVNS